MNNILVAQSGGPTVAINASLAGVIEQGMKLDGVTVYGGCNGIQGILEDRIIELNPIFEEKGKLDLLKQTPAMFLGSCRYKMKPYTEDESDYEKLVEIFEKYDIKAFFYIGGNDSMDTVLRVSEFVRDKGKHVRVIGVPKTIDNDLMMIDHTPGFGSAAKYIASSIREVAMDTFIYNIDTVVIVEIMGRNAGWLTAASALARQEGNLAPQLIYLPEVPFDREEFLQSVKRALFRHHHVIVAVSEGIKDTEGKYISAGEAKLDKFGHAMLSGTGNVLKQLIDERIGCKVRSIELNVLQRAAAHEASKTDLDESMQLGINAVNYALEGKTGVMSTLTRTSSKPYKVEYSSVDIEGIANEEKKVPLEWITPSNTDVTQDMIDYLLPLIQGEPATIYKDGLPLYLTDRNKLY